MLNSSQQICHYFNTRSGCRFGRNCRFSHVKYKPPLSHLNKHGATVSKEEVLEARDPKETDFDPVPTKRQDEELELSTSTTPREESKEKGRGICFTFQKYQRCRFGENCRFLHSIPPVRGINNTNLESSDNNNAAGPKNLNEEVVKEGVHNQDKGKRPCQFYLGGFCKKGDRCRLYHPNGGAGVDNIDVLLQEDLQIRDDRNRRGGRGYEGRGRSGRGKHAARPVFRPKELRKQDATEEDLKKLNKTEREQLKKRLSTNDVEIVEETEDGGCYRFTFASSDPDWPYDVQDFRLEVNFPLKYPIKMFQVSLPREQDLPETVRRHVEMALVDWTKKKQEEMEKCETLPLVFRPFLVWLDRNLEDIVTEGLRQLKKDLAAKAAGFEFIPAHQLQRQQEEKMQASSEDSDEEDDSEDGSEEEDEEDSDDIDPRYAPRPLIYRKRRDSEEERYTGPAREDSDYEADIVDNAMSKTDKKEEDQRKGTEMKLRNLQLRENAATMAFTKVKVVVQCARCKNKSDVVMSAGRPSLVSCMKCNNPQVVNFRPAIMHQFSSVMGYLDLDGCSAFDLILQESEFKLGCFNCNKEMKGKSLNPGQFSDTWCQSCHAKMRVLGESVKFSILEPSSLELDKEGLHKADVQKARKIPKDPAIQLGSPLPYDGTCKHYKKSFRWFRFPCCGKAYPCDICHEEKEGHEMVLANRMICGHCSKEQPFALEKPCTGCSMSMTKARTAHWEGGKGCRDRIKMSRNDPQKYSGQAKTKSRKAQEKAKPSEKKTKLRHSSA